MSKKYTVRAMKENEVSLAIEWARQEGWNPGLNDGTCFYQADPHGFFIGLLDGEPIATGAAVAYSDHYAFCGLYIVKSEFRKQGYGMKLTEERLKYVGSRITGLDGVLSMASKYEKIGYVPAYTNTRYALLSKLPFTFSPDVIDLKKVPFSDLESFDRNYFPAPRPTFLHNWICQANAYALGYMQDQKLQGYGVLRKCMRGYKIGPLFAKTPRVAQVLFESLCFKAKEGPIFLDTPEPNSNGKLLVKYYGMTPTFEVIRMYRNGTPEVDLQGTYGITTYEIG